ncbi:hypothetical protein P8C59_004902 [Phyllachora maydis]|uniref:Protein kinase domain-containing protein n=1 Tax=Phyllachora maydis TaxID=1825666 RepID=A0AAD9MEX6_9PEZI|nr:hypothetical protein P8C59_004902 [Phyllachora maydis]
MQQFKNLLRHGKQARAGNYDDPPRAKADVSSAQQSEPAQKKNMPALSEPMIGSASVGRNQYPPEAYSIAPGVHVQNRVAQANDLAAHHAEAGLSAEKRGKRDVDIAKLVAEENARKSKFPRYPGLTDDWELLEKMGDGAFSNVYRARNIKGEYDGEVAIKVVRRFEMSSMQQANIEKEVQIMRNLDHPNIIKLIKFIPAKEYFYIILELAPGGELFHQIVRLTYFSEELSRHVITEVAKALEYLHEERGVVHRDIKPENILFVPIPVVQSKTPKPKQPGDEDKVDEGEFIKGVGGGGIGRIKIADFGLSKVVWEDQTMTPCGTVGYTAPEIVKDERYSKSVDMWALGCVLYTLLCGFPPFYDESIEVLTEKVAKGQYTFLSPWWDEISPLAQDLIAHLLEVDPRKRYTIREFLAHPWIREPGASTPAIDRKPALSVDGITPLRAFDVGRLNDGGKRYDFRSPGAVNLREVFDVSYAVHRQEEESRRMAGASRLVNLNEEDEVEDEEMVDGDSGARQLEQSMRDAHITKDEQQQRGRDRDRQRHQQQQQQAPQSAAGAQKGYGQHSPAVTAAARMQGGAG